MDLLRRHLFLIVCGLAAVGGIALGVTGIQAMPRVQQELDRAASLYRSLEGLQSNPVNRQRIEAEQQRIESILTDHRRVMERARQLYAGYDLMEPGVLPYGDAVARLKFRTLYGERMHGLLASLTGGQTATNAEIDMWRRRIEEEQAARRAEGKPEDTSPRATPAGVLTEAAIRVDPVARAHLAAAQRIYCYVTGFAKKAKTEQEPSLEFDPIMAMTETADPPFPYEVWRAQLGYWIQRDIVDAIVSVNEEAAEAARQEGRQPWVGLMPVKEVLSVRLSDGFIPPDGGIFVGHEPGGYGPALPPGTPATVFTLNGSGPFYEVVQFTLKLVMDQRDIPLLVERLCNNRFHTLLRVAYVAVPPNRRMEGKIYGDEPAVNVVMDFETVLLGEVFRRFMPQYTREFYGVPCREVDECVDEPA